VSVFVDTSALYALLVETEEEHAAVATEFRRLLERGRAIVTTNYVILETAAVLQSRFGLAPVRDLESEIAPVLHVAWVREDLHRRALERLLSTDRREVSLVDCSSFEAMDEAGIREALALDEDFERAGYRVLPG
jgi:predicted nucleic acid-binding protein